jgi:lysophospholipase L1-like esterase
MKTFLLHFLFGLSIITARAQNRAWDSTYRPVTWKVQVDQFRSYPNSKKDIIFVGNSITAGVDWYELLGNPHVRNRGISSDISFGVLERLDEITEGKPSKVFILIGINDISRNVPDSFILRNYRLMIERIREASPKTKIYFQSILPVNNEFTPTRNQFNKDEHILYVNQELKKLAEKENVFFIDLHSRFLDGNGKLGKRYTHDGLHLNHEGYRVWADILKKGKYLEK